MKYRSIEDFPVCLENICKFKSIGINWDNKGKALCLKEADAY